MWQQGQSGNPAGRPKDGNTLAEYIRERTDNGKELVDSALNIFRNSMDPEIKHKYLSWLGDRGWGRAYQAIEMTGKDGQPLMFAQVNFAEGKAWKKE